jgi:hypothetical protein
VARRRTWGCSRIWEEKLALVRTCHSGWPAAAPGLAAAAAACSALARRKRIAHGMAVPSRGSMAAAVPAATAGV